MAFRLAEAYVELSNRGARGLLGVLGNVHRRVMSLLNPINLVTGALATMGTALTAREVARAFARQELAEKRVEAVVRATGGAAGWTAQQLKQMAADLQRVTMFGDEATLEAQAMLLTFKSIRGDLFQGVLESAMDIASVFQTDLRSAVLQVGKAFEDPARQMTYLRRSGVTFSEQQERQIKQLQKAGRLADAQAVMLRVLQGQFGGAAREMAKTAPGAFAQMRNSVGDMLEDIGRAFSEAFGVKGAAAGLRDFADRFRDEYGVKIRNALLTIRAISERTWETMALGFRFAAEQLRKIMPSIPDWFREAFHSIVGDLDVLLGSWQGFQLGIANIAIQGRFMLEATWAQFMHWLKSQWVDFANWLPPVIVGMTQGVMAALSVGAAEQAKIIKAMQKQMGRAMAGTVPDQAELDKQLKNRLLILEAMADAQAKVWAMAQAGLPKLSAQFGAPFRPEELPGAEGRGGGGAEDFARTAKFQMTTLTGLTEAMQQAAAEKLQERTANATERTAKATERLAEQGLNPRQQAGFQQLGVPTWGQIALGR